jgi:hypothetical protein
MDKIGLEEKIDNKIVAVLNKNNKPRWITIDNERIAVRKSWDGWRVVKPYKDEQGKYIWKNILGSWQSWVKSIIFLLIILGFYYVYAHDTAICRETVQRDLAYFINMTQSLKNMDNQASNTFNNFTMNYSWR